MDIPDGDGLNNAYISTYLMMDSSYYKTTRQVETFSMVFSDTGGFLTIVFMLTEIFVSRLQGIIYYTTLIEQTNIDVDKS